jgi:hypothetical protein
LKSKNLHFNGFDYEGKFKMMGVGQTACLYAQAPTLWDMMLEPDAALNSCCKTVGFGMQTGDISDLDRTRQYCIALEAVSPGTGTLFLRHEKTRAVLDQVQVQVVSSRSVKVCFYNLRDKLGREGCSEFLQRRNSFINGSGLDTAVAHVNDIVGRQANVQMSLRGGTNNHSPLRVLNVFDLDLGDKPILDFLAPKVFGKPGFDGDAQLHVCWIWGSSMPKDLGVTTANFTFLVAPQILKGPKEDKFVRVTAHEYMHFLCGSASRGLKSHDSNETDLMLEDYPQGVMLRKARLKQIIR